MPLWDWLRRLNWWFAAHSTWTQDEGTPCTLWHCSVAAARLQPLPLLHELLHVCTWL